jgi:hypothetical protein
VRDRFRPGARQSWTRGSPGRGHRRSRVLFVTRQLVLSLFHELVRFGSHIEKRMIFGLFIGLRGGAGLIGSGIGCCGMLRLEVGVGQRKFKGEGNDAVRELVIVFEERRIGGLGDQLLLDGEMPVPFDALVEEEKNAMRVNRLEGAILRVCEQLPACRGQENCDDENKNANAGADFPAHSVLNGYPMRIDSEDGGAFSGHRSPPFVQAAFSPEFGAEATAFSRGLSKC